MIPDSIKSNYRYYKQEKHFYCKHCNSKNSKFTFLKFKDDKIFWQFNCERCGESFEYFLPYLKFKKLYLDYKRSNYKPLVKYFYLWQIFRLGLYYREVFKHEKDRDDFGICLTRLTRDSTGVRVLFFKLKIFINRIWRRICK